MLKYVYVSPSDFLVVVLGRGVARIGGRRGWARAITLAVGVLVLGVPFDLGAVDWPLLVASMVLGVVAIVAIGARCSPRSACRRARSRGPIRRPSPARCSSSSGACSRSPSCRRSPRRSAC